MTNLRSTIGLALLCALAAGCGGGSSSRGATVAATNSAATTAVTSSGVAVTSSVTPPPSRPLAGVHGELIAAPAVAGTALAFLPDGAADALEIADASALSAAGAHAGWTLVVDGDARPNQAGATALAEGLWVAGFELDERVLAGEVQPLPRIGDLVLRDVDGDVYEPSGPLAAALLASSGPVRVTGRLDPAGPGVHGPRLLVTSWRPAVRIGLNEVRPLIGGSSFDVDDLQGSGAYRLESFQAFPRHEVRGRGRRLEAGVVSDLQGLVAAADLPNQPAVIQPPQVYPDHPSVRVSLRDGAGLHQVRIYSGAAVPPALDALIRRLQALADAVPAARSLDQGEQSQVTQAGVEVARDAAALGALYARHAPGARPPAVDFSQDLVVAAFDGQRPTGGYSIEVARAELIGDVLYLTTRSQAPTGPAPSVLTAPFVLVQATRTAGLVVDGQPR